MSLATDSSLILLTYKGKILLTLFENDPLILNSPYLIKQHKWRFIGGENEEAESCIDSIINRVRRVAGIRLSQIDIVSTDLSGSQKRYLYHARLSDEQVNNIERGEGHLLQFFSLKELETLPLSDATKLFVSKHRDFMEKIYTKPASESIN